MSKDFCHLSIEEPKNIIYADPWFNAALEDEDIPLLTGPVYR
jgi:hypothetical protein